MQEYAPLDASSETPWLAAVLAHCATASPRDRELLERRTLADPPATLQDLAREWNVTRERVRQLEERWIERCPVVQPARLDDLLERSRAGRTTPLRLPELAQRAPWLAGVDGHRALFAAALRSFRCRHRFCPDDDGGYVTLAIASDRAKVLRPCRAALRDPAMRRRTMQQKAAAVAAVLHELGVAELAPVVLAHLEAEGAGVIEPTNRERVEHLLEQAEQPMTFQQILKAMAPMSARRLSIVLAEADVAHAGHRSYVLRRKLPDLTPLLPQVHDDVLAFLGCEPELQWGTAKLLAALEEAGAEWAATLPLAAFETLIERIDGVKNLKRGLWGLAAAHDSRRQIIDIAIEVLAANGGPMPFERVFAAVQERRSTGQTWRPRFPVVILADGRLGLGERDLGLTPAVFAAWTHAVQQRIDAGVPVAAGDLPALMVEVGGPQLAEEVLLANLGGEQTLIARFRAQLGHPARRGGDPAQ